MHIVLIHQCGDAVLMADAAQHQPLHFRAVQPFAPTCRLERHEGIGLADLCVSGPAGRAMLAVAYGFGFNVVEGVAIVQQRQASELSLTLSFVLYSPISFHES